MKKIVFFSLCLIFFSVSLTGYTRSNTLTPMDSLFEEIRKDKNFLRVFLKEIPKGGDIHHHYSGAIYPEDYIKILIENNLYIHPKTLVIKEKLRYDDGGFERVQTLIKKGKFERIRNQLLKLWSAKDFMPTKDESSADFFFKTFEKFGPIEKLSYLNGLIQLKKRAVAEHVSYIETMFTHPKVPIFDTALYQQYNHDLQKAQLTHDTLQVRKILNDFFAFLEKNNIASYADKQRESIKNLHNDLLLDDNFFTIRYQNFVVRTFPPSSVFQNLVAAFLTAVHNPLIVGINIVGPEHNPVALHDYWLHMQMYKYLHSQFPNVSYAMHAGELTPNLATPEALSSHISEAVKTANASRIGHGIDIGFENNADPLLQEMATLPVPVEINLSSNEFILGIANKEHPILLYKQYEVPIIIATDDAGIIRSTLTEEYVLLAERYPQFSYEEIKEIIYNSIRYSLAENSTKEKLLKRLEWDFFNFEKKWLTHPIKNKLLNIVL